jgi:hypothetical protein
LVPDPTTPPILLGFAGSDPQFSSLELATVEKVGLTYFLNLFRTVMKCAARPYERFDFIGLRGV